MSLRGVLEVWGRPLLPQGPLDGDELGRCAWLAVRSLPCTGPCLHLLYRVGLGEGTTRAPGVVPGPRSARDERGRWWWSGWKRAVRGGPRKATQMACAFQVVTKETLRGSRGGTVWVTPGQADRLPVLRVGLRVTSAICREHPPPSWESPGRSLSASCEHGGGRVGPGFGAPLLKSPALHWVNTQGRGAPGRPPR